MKLEWPWRRPDLLTSLELLRDEPPALPTDGIDPRWPDLTFAVHYLVDDTFWDQTDIADSIGLILRDQTEADMARELVDLLVRVSDRQGAASSDACWFGDPDWPSVREAASRLLVAMSNE